MRLSIVRSRTFVLLLGLGALGSCEGPVGPAGPPGTDGVIGPQGPTGPATSTCAASGIRAQLSVSAPPNGSFFQRGEAPVVTIKLVDGCDRVLAPSALGTASLYLSGPRRTVATRTASKLLNCVTDRAASDRQHHFVNLIAPRYADATKPNLSTDVDGSLRYRLAPISDEEPGTYTAGLWVKSKDETEQLFPLAALQLGTATVEPYASGPADGSTCADCHKGPGSAKLYMAHITPGFSPLGNFALDAAPVGTCQGCHNIDGYSANPIVRKVHGAHRGEHQLNAGIAHPDYGLGADATLKEYLDIGFPAMPAAEKDCVRCHRDDRWLTAPSRLGCGTCHDAVFFDKGVLTPPRRLAGTCKVDADCTAGGGLATCDTATSACYVRTHPTQADDSQCATCHSADSSGTVPIALSHEEPTRTRVRGIKLSDLTIAGSGGGAAVNVGEALVVRFKLADGKGAVLGDLKSNAAYGATLLIGGPSAAPHLVLPSINARTTGTLTFDAQSGSYTYTTAATFPANAQPPLNSGLATGEPNAPGTYTAWVYVTESVPFNGATIRDVATATVLFRVTDANLPLQPRQVITRAACDSCHGLTQAHGGTRRDAGACFVCHNRGAKDRGVGGVGAACTQSSDCQSFEACRDTNNDGKLDTCVIAVDPTPNQTIDFGPMVHQIHYARRLGGYATRDNAVNPGKLNIIGNRNGVNDFSEILLPLDVRQCQKCHADSGAACSATSPCGSGQACVSGKCVNRSFTTPSTAICLSCHDTAAAAGHAALNTWQSGATTVETCAVCHGPDGDFAVSKVHNVTSPYVPPYSRTAEAN